MTPAELKIDQKILELIEIINSYPEGAPLDDLMARSELLDEDSEVILDLLAAFNYQLDICEKSGQKIVKRVLEKDRADYGFSPKELYFVRQLEKLLRQGCIIDPVFDSEFELIVHRILFIEGKISVIGEKVENGSLEIIAIEEISTIKESSNQAIPKYGDSEIEDFLIELRKLSDNEVRLVLKVDASDNRDFFPKYHFARKPYAISNMKGHKIWAASVELTDDLYAWLISISDSIEILDPMEAKKGILKYCEETLYQEIEKRKASNE